MKEYTIIAYATPNYAEEMDRLETSVKKHGYDKIFVSTRLEDLGTWRKNNLYKATFVRKMIEFCQTPVLYLDADATIERKLMLIDPGIDADIAVHYKDGCELLASTLYFNNTVATLKLLDEWVRRSALPDADNDQIILQGIINDFNGKIRLFELPPDYCLIFDLMAHQSTNPAIIQHQASRTHRR